MVIFTSCLIDAQRASGDRYRPVLSLASEPVGRLIDLQVRTKAPMSAMFTGEVRPVAVGANAVGCEKPQAAWHQGTDHNFTTVFFTTVFGGGFAGRADGVQTRVGPPPPPCRRSV